MSAWWLFFLVYSFVIFSVEGDGNSNSASSTAEVPSQGTSCLARPSQRPDSAEFCKTQESSWNTAVPSLQGLWLPLQDPSRDDELTGIWVALWLLQENALAERLVLRPVWSELGELCSPYGQAGWTESRPVEFLADCEHCFEDEEPKAAETVVKEEKQMERFGTAIKFACRAILAWKCNSMASDAADVLSNASWMGSQRAWKRNSTELSAASNACTSTIAAATAYDEWLSVTARRVDIAKKRADAMNKDEDISLITEDEMEDSEAREEEEIPRDENAQKIQEGLNNVVSSLTELSDSADKLEPKPKRPRTRDDENPGDSKAGGRQPSLQPFRKAFQGKGAPEQFPQVLSSWSDHVHNDELLNIAIATPEVRVQTTHKQHHADLVLIQGDPERKGAIITVYPPGVEEHLSTTLAVSLPEHVSGMDVITGAEAQDLLLSHACDVFHAGFQLPIGTVPTHWMANGHTFVVIFQDMQTETNNEIESALPALSSETIDQAETLDEEPIENENEQEGGESEPHQESSSSFDEEALQGLWIHQFHQPAHHCFVRWTTYNVILFDALQSVGLHRDLAVGFHYVQAPLVDQHEAEESIIIQRVGDIEGGSPAKLVIVDLTFAGQLQGSPTYHRRVQVFPRHLSRTGVLQELNLADPCVIEADRCTLHLNNALWAKEDAAPRELAHGAYLRLEVRLRNDEQEVKVQSAT
ncbi:unnamed protein product [Cladocopium goreaui]|uniref:Uncharacterized protein n=1 Tax=Cladocopium goreaui TaxID=2562237 RepID=A0A9P1BH59_9DINO|nr:unnamed protein product [Cladocopium goreaui]